jgi:hypothetical protein
MKEIEINQESTRLRATGIFLVWCITIFSLMYFYPMVLIVIGFIFFIGAISIKRKMNGVVQEVFYMGFLALAICVPIGVMYANS